jgi:transcriptional regulator with XRE-family HTH domain
MATRNKEKRPTTDHELGDVLGRALRETREEQGYTQAAVAEHLDVHQATVSTIELGQRCATHSELAMLEDWWGLPRGYIQRRAGIIDDPTNTKQAIYADPALSAEAVAMLVAAYDALVKSSRRQ